MCGRAKLVATGEELREAFDLLEAPELPPRFNVAPSQPIAVVRAPHRLERLRWGLVVTGSGAPKINVRLESVARVPAYRGSFRARRCLVVVDGFYEWKRETMTGSAKPRSRPHLVQRADGKPFALGGIWDRTVTPDGEIVESCAVLTGEARGITASIHDRMPLVIPRAAYARWLDPTADVRDLLVTRADDMVARPVSDVVSSPANDDPRCIAPPADDVAGEGSGGRAREEEAPGETLSLFADRSLTRSIA